MRVTFLREAFLIIIRGLLHLIALCLVVVVIVLSIMSLVLPSFLQRQTQPIDLMSLVWSPSKETQDCGKECLGKKFQCQSQFRTIECFYLINTLTKQMSLDKSSSLVAPEIRPIHKK